MTDQTKTAMELAEKELQEEEISKIKNIVKDYLQKIAEKEKENKKIVKEISLLKKDLDDFKAGRLDKVVERQQIEPLSPKIVIIHKIEKEYIPVRPWYSPWEIVYPIQTVPVPYDPYQISFVSNGLCSLSNSPQCSNPVSNIMGNMFKNFSGGSYDIGGSIVNL